MSDDKYSVIKYDLIIPVSRARVWNRLTQPSAASRLFSEDASSQLASDGAGGLSGRLRVGAELFKLRMRPFDALATSAGCRLALRLTESGEDTLAVAAASCAPGGGFEVCADDLERFLKRLRSLAVSDEPERAASRKVYKNPVEGGAAGRDRPDESGASRRAGGQKSRGAGGRTDGARGGPSGGRAWAAALGIIAAAAAAFALWSFWPFSGATASASAANAADLSPSVTAQNASMLSLGMTLSEVEALLGTDGVKTGAGAYTYRCDELNGQGQPARQIRCVYESDKLVSSTYLDLDIAQQTGAVGAIPAAAGSYPVSMTRLYTLNGEEISETHSGFVDPFANFSGAWRGEMCVKENRSSGQVTASYVKGCDGNDPLMIDSLDGRAVAAQYDSYDEFLADKLAFDEAMLIANDYSRGDAASVFGAPEEYDAGGGVTLLRVRKGETGEDGEPIYDYSFDFDATGAFKLGSFSNSRLYAKAGSFAGCKTAEVGPGQSWNEVRRLLPIVPTALFVNENFCYVCYGRYTGGSEIKYQFELVVSLDKTTYISDSVYDNTIPQTEDAA